MNKFEVWFSKYAEIWRFFRTISTDLEIEPHISSLAGLEAHIRRSEPLFVEIRYADEPFGAAAEGVAELLALFARLRGELGEHRFDFVSLPREHVTLDFTPCRYVGEVYGEMREKMDWADFYGENPNALWDILTGMPYRGDDFTILRPRRYHDIPWGHDESFTRTVDQICRIFTKAAADEHPGITVEIRYTDE